MPDLISVLDESSGGEGESSYEDEFSQDNTKSRAIKPTPPNKKQVKSESSSEDDEAYSTSNKRSSVEKSVKNKKDNSYSSSHPKGTDESRDSHDTSIKAKTTGKKAIKPIQNISKIRGNNALMKSKDTSKDDYDDDFDDEQDSKLPKKSMESVTEEIGFKGIGNRSKATPVPTYSQKVSPRGGNKLSTKLHSAFNSDIDRKSQRNKMNRSMASDFNRSTIKTYLKNKVKTNPLVAIEMDMKLAKNQMLRISKLRQMAEEQHDEHSRLVCLNRE